ncbi:MAG TPA: TCP-1/cpn60 chaperonin family protein [Syntrophomonadaceae bacterium]|nr:TCP-1/cpn60 chaperonin family protein [Syntrophomonadaceae bacterium]
MSENLLANSQTTDDKFETLLNNANAARVISQAVEGTLGPKGLDIMMVDKFGDVVITNDGVTIMKLMEVNHPAARMIINAAKAQQSEIGDGTTTTTIIAGALVAEGCQQVMKGVPVTRVIDGINRGINRAIELVDNNVQELDENDYELLYNVASVAGRGHEDLASLIVDGAMAIGKKQLLDPDYKFADAILAREFSDNEVIKGVVINKEPINKEMPSELTAVKMLVIDDKLAPEELENDAIKTETGFKYYIQSKEKYQENLLKIKELGVNVVIIDKALDDVAEEFFTQAGIIALHRVSTREIDRICRYTGAKKIKRNTLNRNLDTIATYLGTAEKIRVDEKLENTIIYGGRIGNWVTVMIGAATEEVVDEKERMAKDAASALQAALRGGVIPGGGAMEIWISTQLEDLAKDLDGMTSFGVNCVKEALVRPFACMIDNAGFNPLEKLGDVVAGQRKIGSNAIGIDCETGKILDVFNYGIIDAALVKIHAIKAAGEVAVAILRINTIIRMKSEENINDFDMLD